MYKEMISNCSVEIYDTYQEHDNEEVMCEVVLKSNNSTRYIYFLNYSKAIISNRINPEYCVEEIDLYSNFSGIYRIASNTYSKCIRNIIQSNKLLHLKNISSGGWSILNMFMKNVPVEFPKYINMLDIEIKNIGVRGVVDKSFSTLNVINIPEMNIQPISVGFQVEKL